MKPNNGGRFFNRRHGTGGMETRSAYIPNAKELEKVHKVFKFSGESHHERKRRMIKNAAKVRDIRVAEQEMVDLPFGLFDLERNRVHDKVVNMTEFEARERNKTISDLGMAWCRIGY